ncbi:hypothetical protein BJX61DRAFT_503091 [Aspergillus egyptiacus]|nr:hypothetical protein BJX61DRAFT_503091 [Aspergillus egyptiacus]
MELHNLLLFGVISVGSFSVLRRSCLHVGAWGSGLGGGLRTSRSRILLLGRRSKVGMVYERMGAVQKALYSDLYKYHSYLEIVFASTSEEY